MEKIVRSRQKANLLTTGALYVGATMFKKLGALILLPLYLKLFTLKTFGVFDLCITISNVIFLICEAQVSISYERFYYEAKSHGKLAELASGALSIYFVIFILASIVGGLFFWSVSGFAFSHQFPFVLFLPVFASFIPKQIYLLLLANLRLENARYSFVFYSVMQSFIGLAATVILLLVFRQGVLGALWGVYFGYFILLPFIVVHFYWLTRFRLNRRAYVLSLLKYGLPVLPAAASTQLMMVSGRFVVVAMLSLSSLGVYSTINRISSAFSLLVEALKLVWGPLVTKRFQQPKNEVANFMFKAIHLYSVGGAIGSFLILILSPLIFKLIFPRVADMYYYLAFPVLGLYWQGWGAVWMSCINWSKKTQIISFAVVFGVVVTIILQLLFVSHYGLLAAFAASLFGNVLTSYILKRFSSMSLGVVVSPVFWLSNVLVSLLLPIVLCWSGLHSILLYTSALIFVGSLIVIISLWLNYFRVKKII